MSVNHSPLSMQSFMHVTKKFKNLFSRKGILFFLYRHYKAMFFLGFLVVLGLGGFYWNANLNQYQWSEERKKSFVEQNFKETRFKSEAFHVIVKQLEARARAHEVNPALTRDVFSGKKL